MLVIDGSRFSGSGTIVRYAVALATVKGTPVQVTNIRVRRPKPGLRRQHLRAILACARISRGRVEGAEVGSQEIVYHAGPSIVQGTYTFDVGSAGSTALLSFALMIPALYATGPCSFTLIGGLFQDFAPTAFHMKQCLLPLISRMGARVVMDVQRPGYVPRGQGCLFIETDPLHRPLKPLRLLDRGETRAVSGVALASHLAQQRVALRMAETCEHVLRKRGMRPTFEIMEDDTAAQPGAALAIWMETAEGAMLGADMAGAPGRPSEKIGQRVGHALLDDLDTGATVDRHLADQLIVFAALGDGSTSYRVPSVTEHVESNLWLVREMLGAKADIRGNIVTVEGIGLQRSPQEVL